ncbi:MAG: hypothetical protein LBD24_01460 [Spirochaetaceae bacterium]|nr:hypothetical protein [Spirochaetaceae bacterium]
MKQPEAAEAAAMLKPSETAETAVAYNGKVCHTARVGARLLFHFSIFP